MSTYKKKTLLFSNCFTARVSDITGMNEKIYEF